MRTLLLAVSALAAAVAFPGCIEGTEGLSGVYTFYDRTPPAEHAFPWDSNQELNAPLAVGARLDVGVARLGIAFRPARVEVSPSSVASVVSLQDYGFTLRATAPGRAVVTVHGGSQQDQVAIEIREPDHAEILLRPWNWYPLPSSYFDQGLAVLEGATSHLFGLAMASGQSLTGYGPYEFHPGPQDGSPLLATPREGSNFLDLKGVRPGVEQFTFGPSDPVEVAVITEADIARVEILEAAHTQAGPDLVCTAGETLYVLLVPYDGQGRMVAGTTTGDAPTVTIPEPSLAFLTDTTPANPSTELTEILQNRTVFVRCEAAGSATGTIRWRTFEVAFRVTIAAKAG